MKAASLAFEEDKDRNSPCGYCATVFDTSLLLLTWTAPCFINVGLFYTRCKLCDKRKLTEVRKKGSVLSTDRLGPELSCIGCA